MLGEALLIAALHCNYYNVLYYSVLYYAYIEGLDEVLLGEALLSRSFKTKLTLSSVYHNVGPRRSPARRSAAAAQTQETTTKKQTITIILIIW